MIGARPFNLNNLRQKPRMPALLTPQFLARQLGTLGQRIKFRDSQTGIGQMPQTAVGVGDKVFFADQFGEADDALGDQFGMFDEEADVVDDAGAEDFALGQLGLLPDLPFMAVAWVGGLNRNAGDVGFGRRECTGSLFSDRCSRTAPNLTIPAK